MAKRSEKAVPLTGVGAMHRNNFDALRLCMALLVIWSHSFALYFGTEAREPVSMLLAGHYNAGNVGVRVFFIVSGFLICHSWLRSPDIADYLGRRIMRIYPGFLVAAAICAFVVVPLFSVQGWAALTPGEVLKSLGSHLLLRDRMPTADTFPDNPIAAVNGALWSIPFEFWCYLATPVIGLLGLLRRRGLLLALAVAIMAVRVWLDLTGRQPGGGVIGLIIGWPYAWFNLAPCFLAGMLVRLYHDRLTRSPALLVAGVVAMVAAANLLPGIWSKIICDLLFPPVVAYATFMFAFSSRLRLHGVARHGDFSYGTYLYGFPIQQMVMALAGGWMPFAVYVPVVTALSLAAGVLSWNAVEKHFLPRSRQQKVPAAAAEA